jgi:rhodanese-related sulfurtransferase
MVNLVQEWLRRGGTPAWIEIGDLHRRLGADELITVIDVRQPEEFSTPPGHLPGAVNIPLAEIPTRATELAESEQPIVLVCKTDRRSANAASALLEAGAQDVAVLRGGTVGWHAQGLPLQ